MWERSVHVGRISWIGVPRTVSSRTSVHHRWPESYLFTLVALATPEGEALVPVTTALDADAIGRMLRFELASRCLTDSLLLEHHEIFLDGILIACHDTVRSWTCAPPEMTNS